MTNNEFFYWFQGYFEIGGLSVSGHGILNKNQCICILKHTKLVQKNRSENLGKIIAIVEAMIENQMTLENGSSKIIEIVSDQFEHVVDPQHGDKLDELRKIHDSPDEIMC